MCDGLSDKTVLSDRSSTHGWQAYPTYKMQGNSLSRGGEGQVEDPATGEGEGEYGKSCKPKI
jgi:hypothetical protein